jgi:hypothetical protein
MNREMAAVRTKINLSFLRLHQIEDPSEGPAVSKNHRKKKRHFFFGGNKCPICHQFESVFYCDFQSESVFVCYGCHVQAMQNRIEALIMQRRELHRRKHERAAAAHGKPRAA